MAKLLGGTTVYGTLSASGVISDATNSSSQWNNTYTNVVGNSAIWSVGGVMQPPITANSTVGGIPSGYTFTANTPLSSIIQRLLVAAIPYVYIYPTLTINASGNYYEVGTLLSQTLTSVYTQNDAGSATNFILLTSNNIATNFLPITAIALTNSVNFNSLSSYTTTPFYLLSTTYFELSTSFAQGPQRQDNYGNNSGIPLSASALTAFTAVTAYRNIFYTSDTSTVSPSSSNNIRALSSTPALLKTQAVVFNSTNGSNSRVVFAHPSQYIVTSVTIGGNTYNNTLNSNTIVNNFSVSSVAVSGANSLFPISYRVFQYNQGSPSTGNITVNTDYNTSVQYSSATPSTNINISPNNTTDEIGKSIPTTITYSYTQNQGGGQTAVALLTGTNPGSGSSYTSISSTNNSSTSLTFTSTITIPSTNTSTIYFATSTNYGAGPKLYNNYSDYYGFLPAGNYTSNGSSASVTGQYRVYVGATTQNPPNNSQIISGSTGYSLLSALSPTRPTGTYSFVFGSSPAYYIFVAYPAAMGPSSFVQGGLGATYNLYTISNFTNQYGVATPYYVYVSPANYINSSQTLIIS